jgi:hypothetical protein
MPQKNHRAREMQKSAEIRSAPFVPGDEPTGVLEPGKETFDFPAALVAAQLPAILRQMHPVRPVGGDHLDAARGERLVEAIAVVGGIANQSVRIVGQEARV